MVRRAVVALLAALASAPAPAIEVGVAVGHARVTADPFPFASPDLPGVDRVPSFSRDVGVMAASVRFDLLAVVPVSVSAFASDTDTFTHSYPLGPLLPAEVEVTHTLRTRGARVAFAPWLPLGNGWELDGMAGVQLARHDVTTDLPGVGDESFDEIGLFAGAGVTWWPVPLVGVRAGVDFADGYRGVSVGVRIGF